MNAREMEVTTQTGRPGVGDGWLLAVRLVTGILFQLEVASATVAVLALWRLRL